MALSRAKEATDPDAYPFGGATACFQQNIQHIAEVTFDRFRGDVFVHFHPDSPRVVVRNFDHRCYLPIGVSFEDLFDLHPIHLH